MSQDQNSVQQTGPPKRFLRKGEGLKRFAAYKPPLPTTAKKVERRQTFVRFKLDRNSSTVTKEPAHFMPPELLNDDSINLSTEIPKIAPPKIIHTPIRPNRNALGTLTNESSLFADSQIDGNIDKLLEKIEKKKSTLSIRRDDCYFEDNINSFEYNQDSDTDEQHQVSPQQDTKLTDAGYNSPHLFKSPTKKIPPIKPKGKNCGVQASPIEEPVPSVVIEQIEKIESTFNELREKLKDCACCVSTAKQATRRRPTTRAAAKAAKSKPSDTKPTGPSADVDKSTKEQLDSLVDEFAQLKARLNAIHPRH